MTDTLRSPRVQKVLDRLFAAAELDQDRVVFSGATAQQRADLLHDIYMPVSAQGGILLYSLVRSARPDTVVEFGTSFGISTIYLAAAVAGTGPGDVIGTGQSAQKGQGARSNLAWAGVTEAAPMIPGDARQTLTEVPGPIGMVLLDGWKQLCLP